MSLRFYLGLALLLLAIAAGAKEKKASAEAPADSIPKSTPVVLPDLSLELPSGSELTLDGAIQLAVRSASSVLKSENAERDTGAQLLQAYGQFLPSLGGSASFGQTVGKTYLTTGSPTLVDGSGRNAGYAITADLNLFNGLSDLSGLKASLDRHDATKLTVTRAKQQIALDVAQAFLQVVLDRRLVAIARKNLQASQERERLLQEQAEVGARNLSDLFRQQAQTSLDEASQLASENKSRADQIALMQRLRLDVEKKFRFAEPPLAENPGAPAALNEDGLVKEALEKRPDLKASNEQHDADSWGARAAYGNLLPKLDLVAGAVAGGHWLDRQTVNGVDVVPASQSAIGTQLGQQVQYSIGLQLTWNLFDRFATADSITHARVVADNSEIDATDRRRQVQGDVRQAFGDYLTARAQLESSRKGLEAAQKAYEVMSGRYEVGAASFLDLITAQSVLVQAESTRAQALINFELQQKSLRFAVGDLGV